MAQRQAAEDDQPDHQGQHRTAHDLGGDPAPCAPLDLAGHRDPRPEHGPAEDGQQGRQQGEVGEQGHGDPDGQRRAESLVEAEGGDDHGRQGGDDGESREGDRLAHLGEREGHRVVVREAPADLLADAEDEEEAVVGAGPEHHHHQQDRGEVGDLDADVGRRGDERLGGDQGDARGQQGHERGEQGPEGEEEQEQDEHDRQDHGDPLGLGLLGLLVHGLGGIARQVDLEPVGGLVGRERLADVGHGPHGGGSGGPRGQVERDDGLAGPAVGRHRPGR